MQEKDVFGKFIKKKRLQKGLSQKDLASKLFITESAVSKWERGISYPDITLVTGICKALSVTEHELINASDDIHSRSIEDQLLVWKKFKKIVLFGSIILSVLCTLFALSYELRNQGDFSVLFNVLGGVVMFLSVTCVPIIAKKKKLTKSVVLFLTSLLFIICHSYGYQINRLIRIYSEHEFFETWFQRDLASMAFTIQWIICLFIFIFLPLCLKEFNPPKFIKQNKALFCLALDSAIVLIFSLINIFLDNAFMQDILTAYYLSKTNSYLTILLLALPPIWSFFLSLRYLKSINVFSRFSIGFIFTSFYIIILDIIEKLQYPYIKIDFSNAYEIHNTFVNFQYWFYAFIIALFGILCFTIGIILHLKKKHR